MQPTTQQVYLNGDWLPLAEAKVSVLDRGFVFGDGIYEVVPVYGGHPFRLDEHLDRLDRSLDAVHLPNPLSRSQWWQMVQQLVERHGGGDQSLYLQLTRGVAPRDHAFPPPGTAPTVFAMSSPLPPPPEALRRDGIRAITAEDIRWSHCHIKATALLANILLRQQAVERGAQEAILIRDGEVTEGAASNLFVVTNGTLRTPPKSDHLLAGITRDLVVELARDHGIGCREERIGGDELASADEIWVTSSTKEVVAVTLLDQRPVGDGRPGPLWAQMHAHYQAFKERARQGAAR